MALNVTMRVPVSIEAIEAALEGLSSLNYKLMRAAAEHGGAFPSLYDSGIRYRKEHPGEEDWANAIEILKAGGVGDCEDLAGYRVGELRMEGEPAIATVVPTKRGSFHAVVQRGDGSLEDPSRILLANEIGERGLEAVRRSVESEYVPRPCRSQRCGRHEVGLDDHELGAILAELSNWGPPMENFDEQQPYAEPQNASPQGDELDQDDDDGGEPRVRRRRRRKKHRKPVVRVREGASRGGARTYVGELELPCAGGAIRAAAIGAFPWTALKRAAALAERIANDPALAPLIPPQALAAAKTARTISRLARQNPEKLKQLIPQLTPAAQAIAKSFTKHPWYGRGRPYAQPEPEPVEQPYDEHHDEPPDEPEMPHAWMNADDPAEREAVRAWGAEAFEAQQGDESADEGDDYDDYDDDDEDDDDAEVNEPEIIEQQWTETPAPWSESETGG